MNTNEFVQKVQMAILAVFSVFVMSSAGWAAIYYVDATNGNDDNSGTAQATAWKTISKVNLSSFNPGDTILFKRDEVWREQLNVPSSGSSGNPITFGAYGSGNKPIITGADIVTGWKKAAMSNVWYADLERSVSPTVLCPKACKTHVFFDGILGTKVESKTDLDSEYEWYGEGTTLYIYSTSNPDTTYTNLGIEFPVREKGIIIDNRNYDQRTHKYITIEDIHVRNARIRLIDGINSDHLMIKNCLIEYSGPGDANNDCSCISLNHNTKNALVENCISHDAGCGIYIGTAGGTGKEYSATENIVKNNEIYNVHSGVNIKTLSINNTVEGNYIHDIITQGIRAGGSETEGNVITMNFIENCEEDGIQAFSRASMTYNIIKSCYSGIIIIARTNQQAYNIDVGDNNVIYNNVIYDHIIGVAVHNYYGDLPENNTVKNNIISECARAIRFSGGTPPEGNGNVFDYNCYYRSSNLYFGNPGIISFEEWKAIYGGDTNSTISNPVFISSSPSTETDFYLQPTSPCIDAGTDVGFTKDLSGTPVPKGRSFDIGACEYNSLPPPKNFRIVQSNP